MAAPLRSALIPRPFAAAARTAAAVRQRGLMPYILPLTRIEAAPLPPLPRQNYQAVLAASPNAFLPFAPPFAAAAEYRPLKNLPLYCVGGRTAEAAQAQGFASVRYIAANAGELCRFLGAEAEHKGGLTAGGIQLYLAGRPRRPDIENFLIKAKIPYYICETYRSAAQTPSPADLSALPPALDNILLYSAFAAARLPLLAAHISDKTQILCLSARIAAAAPQQWRPQTRIAAQPNEAALLALLA